MNCAGSTVSSFLYLLSVERKRTDKCVTISVNVVLGIIVIVNVIAIMGKRLGRDKGYMCIGVRRLREWDPVHSKRPFYGSQ